MDAESMEFKNEYFDLVIINGGDSILLKLPIPKWQAWMAVFNHSHPKKQKARQG
jgi:hypothetical protein